ncbi:hypothetical protein ABIA33_004964 [Streptacidiphilus sp. MAP12-16]|uniref:sigma factor n=1 Tax=Streptacidiphilus sp. MAP12-16 TaxID=3156300 RepID=UPI003517CA40
MLPDDASAEFHDFFERHYAELARFAHLLTGEADAADDLAADALVTLWQSWDRLRAAEHPRAYARGVVANMARERLRSTVRERRRITLFWSRVPGRTEGPDVAAVLDVRTALTRLPLRRRACVVHPTPPKSSPSSRTTTTGIGRTAPEGNSIPTRHIGHHPPSTSTTADYCAPAYWEAQSTTTDTRHDLRRQINEPRTAGAGAESRRL